MCGICGFIGPNDSSVFAKMVDTLVHRGPNGEGHWEGNGVSLGMRRLAIIDLETGQQPLFNEDRTIAVVFNGEIYNHIELRQSLIKKGHQFRTDHSDGEVIAHLYEEYGADFLHHLNGMFAIALWDEHKQTLLLARDRAGIKPLYFSQTNQGIVFGSEPKALLKHPNVGRDPNFAAIHHYLSFKNIPAPMSAFAGMEQLRAGEVLLYCAGRIDRKRWWRLQYNENNHINQDEAVNTVRNILEDSVRLQMRSDVPVGAYLSGGVDSSSVVALMSKLSSNNINTFTLVYDDGFPHKDADRQYAQEVSEQYGTTHHERLVTYQDVPNFIDAIATSFDEPFSGVISTFFLTQLISEHVKVALSGDGADEVFGSYIGPRMAAPLAYAASKGLAMKDVTDEDLAHLIPFDNDLPRLFETLSRGDEAAQRAGLYIADEADKINLYTDFMKDVAVRHNSEQLIRDLYAECSTKDPVNRALFADFETLLPDQVLPFVDRLSMAHSVEVRPPFLDHRLIEYAATLPGQMKVHRNKVKDVLKLAVADLIPSGIIERPKEGFLMPINDWLLNHLRDFVEDMLSPERLSKQNIFDSARVRTMLDEHYNKRANHGNRLWNMVMLQIWWEKYIA